MKILKLFMPVYDKYSSHIFTIYIHNILGSGIGSGGDVDLDVDSITRLCRRMTPMTLTLN